MKKLSLIVAAAFCLYAISLGKTANGYVTQSTYQSSISKDTTPPMKDKKKWKKQKDSSMSTMPDTTKSY
ncbi:hypothetical protein [Ferruginibacter albus]|uniref:hypothetical protein n=1 Tax=Ferruginibacter albus TaxID=2875540 RepID=UPI001CC3FE12|nr:hypothetical protein [Ferruginibacter albus]UAY53318.1 hypothetical protein K9M53_06510 [Ferruginibacter albus]